MGGLSRKSAYIKTLKNNNIDPIIIDAGDALFEKTKFIGEKLNSEKFKARSFLKGMEKIGCDAFNIGEYDLAGGFEFLKELENESNIPFISANLYSTKTGSPVFNPYIIINKNDLKIGIIGVTDFLSSEIKTLYKTDYISEGQRYINKLRNEVDILVMLVNGSMNNRTKILEGFKDADYIYLSRTVMNTRTTLEQKDGYPIFYTMGLNGKRLIEVKSTFVNDYDPLLDVSSFDYRIASYARQLIRLKKTENNQTVEEKYKDSPQILVQIKNYEDQVKLLESKIKNITNKSEVKLVGLPEKMEYDRSMQKYVDNVLKQVEGK